MNRKLLITSTAAISCLGAGAMTISAFAASPSPSAISIGQQDDPTGTDTSNDDDGGRLAEVLAPLVADGTLTQAQADKVIETLQAARPEGGRGGPGGHHGRGHRDGATIEAAATVIGISQQELITQLRDGSTLAEIATAQGVEPQAVIDALVAEATTRITQAVADGKLTQEEADARLADLTEKIADRVNNGRPEGGPGHRGDLDDDGDETIDEPVTTTGS